MAPPDDSARSFTEKNTSHSDLEAASSNSSATRSSSDYAEGIRRITTTDETHPEHHKNILHKLHSTTRTISRQQTTRTQKDLDAVLNTPFEVRFGGTDDMENPFNWTLLKRGYLLFLVSMQTLVVIFYSTAYVSGSRGMMEEFGITSSTTAILGMTTYLLGLAAGPMFLAPLSEIYGRRPVFLVSLAGFFLLVIPACVAKNMTTILVVRFFGAFLGSVTISNAPGTVGDIFDEDVRVMAFSWFAIAPMEGPVLGPVIGGFVYQSLGWRWNNWLVLILAGVFGLLSLTHPETYAPVLLRKRAERLRAETGDERYMSRFCYKEGEGAIGDLLKNSLQRPVMMLFTEAICIFWAIYIAAIYGILYLCFTAYPIVFSEIRGWGPGVSGLAFLGIGTGTLSALICEPLNHKIYLMHKVDPDTGKRPPEARLVFVLGASILIPASIFWFAWTCVPVTTHWIWPILSGFTYGTLPLTLYADP